jgi:ribosomal protein S18 acetylase RimI-like enzyme
MLAGSELTGFIASTPHSIACLYVAVSHIGRGIGTQLLQLAKSESAGGLWLYTFARNAGARSFYERHGFVDTGHGLDNMWNLEDIKYVWSRCAGTA